MVAVFLHKQFKTWIVQIDMYKLVKWRSFGSLEFFKYSVWTDSFSVLFFLNAPVIVCYCMQIALTLQGKKVEKSDCWSKRGYKIVTTDTLKTGKCGRNSGGLALLYKLKFDDWISVQKESPNFLWFKISNRYTKTTKDIYVCGTYIPPNNSRYFRPELFEELESDIEKFSSLGSILIMGFLL